MDEELYKQNILDHYKNPRHRGFIEKANLTANSSNPTCGDKIVLYIKLDDAGAVEEVGFEGDGCAISLSSVDMLSGFMFGKKVGALKMITPGEIYNMLGVDISPGRVNCALLGYKALENAQKQHESR